MSAERSALDVSQIDASKVAEWAPRVARDTDLVRTRDSPLLQRIRALLAEHGVDVVDVGDSLVVNIMPEGTNLISGYVVTGEARVYEFEYDWRRVRRDEGRFAVWRDVTDSYGTRAFRDPIAVGLSLIRGERAGP